MKKSNTKRLLCLVLSVLLVLLAGCTSGQPAQTTQPAQTQTGTDLTAQIEQTAQWMMTQVPKPGFGSLGGEWMMLGLARSGLEIPREYVETYRENVAAYTAQQGGVLHDKKYTEYSRVILAWTAIGEDAHDVGGYDLLEPLADFDKTSFQGLNGVVFALLALDCGNYDIPQAQPGCVQATRDGYVGYLVDAQTSDGGWNLTGDKADPDLTAMTLQALAKYTDRPDVAAAVQRGLECLSGLQDPDGGFTAYGGQSSETIAQVIVALTELGKSPEDGAFVKNGNTLMDRLLTYRLEDGTFQHVQEEGGEADLMATEQAFYAMVAAQRFREGKSSLYRMTDGTETQN